MTAFFWTLITGVVTAGLVSSLYRLVTNKPPSFQMWQETTVGIIGGVLTLMLAGPSVIMRNALRAQVIENRPPGWLVVSSLMAGLWSFLVGIFVLSLLLV
ncbi:MAG: hypothetical protein CMI60_04680 [Parvibaculum sp.]|jgi:hypothetical protein|nr:hypothetical protein [Parvibaculum sp.]|tara:strand:- start:854 stop:1153 length:300 start_codon:yes stop_codon:yes gene_type:complete